MPLWMFAEKFLIDTSPSAHKTTRPYFRYQFNKEAFRRTCNHGSMTVEAVVVIPILAGFMVCLLFWFRVICIQGVVEEALFLAGRSMAAESSMIDDEMVLFVGAEAQMLRALESQSVVEQYVEHGSLGVILLGSQLDGDYLCLRAHYKVRLPVNLFGIDTITLWSREVVRKWIGDQNRETSGGQVYVTTSGKVYHRMESCRALKVTIDECYWREISMKRGEDGQKYYACICCAEEILDDSKVFYTPYGELYHSRKDCSHLKRNIREVPLSQVGNRRPCSYCY